MTRGRSGVAFKASELLKRGLARGMLAFEAKVTGGSTIDVLNAAATVGGFGATVLGLVVARRSSFNARPPGVSREAWRDELYESSTLAKLPAELEEAIFVAEETPGNVEDDIAAREAAITFLKEQLVQGTTAEERMPVRRRLRYLNSEITQLRSGRTSTLSKLASLFDPVWTFMYKLRPLGRRTRPWLAAVIGFVFGGVGLSIYFRTLIDVGILLALVILVFLAQLVLGVVGFWWVGAAIASLYGFTRAESSNRRLALAAGQSTRVPPGQ